MSLVISNVGEALLLEYMVGKTAVANIKLCLYTNNKTPAQDDTLAAYTELGAVQGYARITLTAASWGAATAGTGVGSATSNKATIAYAQQTFSADGTGGAQNVYGYFLLDNGGTVLIGAERFASAPKSYAVVGDVIKITPSLRLGTE